MKVALWAEIRRLSEREKLSVRQIARQLHCARRTVTKALQLAEPPTGRAQPRPSRLEPYVARITALLEKYPRLSATRVHEEIADGPEGYSGSVASVRRYLRQVRPVRGRVYQEVHYEPGQTLQVDWGECGSLTVGSTKRKVSVFVAVLCYSRMLYLEFTLSQRKAEFYRCLVNALKFFGGSPHYLVCDNLKAAVLNGAGRSACCHPEFLALCGYFCMQPVPCAARDPESKGMVEGSVRYIKHNALAGRSDQLVSLADYQALAASWRDQVANVRRHETTQEQPCDRFVRERPRLRPLPPLPYDTDEVVPAALVSPMARIEFDGNRYSVPPQFARRSLTVRADREVLRILHEGQEVARHPRCYDRRQIQVLPEHRLAALALRHRPSPRALEQAFDALGPEARDFHLELNRRPVKTSVHLRRLLGLAKVYGATALLAAITQALHLGTYDAAYVENLLLAQQRRQHLPTPTLPTPKRRELIDDLEVEPADPARYDRFAQETPEENDHAE